MEILFAGGLVRAFQGLASAAPTLVVGLFIAAILRYYLGSAGTHRLFGGDGLRSLPQAWLVGMLLPVCSIGVIPIIREMKRMGLRPGAITAFALSAPLFNPLSLLYGLTLSRPLVIVGFALGSLIVVTALGIIWDRNTSWKPGLGTREETPIGLRRLGFCGLYMARELCGTTGLLSLVAGLGLFVLGFCLPHGSLQSSVEQLDPLAPLKMAVVAVPIYATPMLTMSQLGMMFAHGNSPGAAFCLLLLGTGMNLATLWWIARNYGRKPTVIWFVALLSVVLVCAYAVERPLIPPGVAAGHTHAFDVYTNPFQQETTLTARSVWETTKKTVGLTDWLGLAVVGLLACSGLASLTVFSKLSSQFLSHIPPLPEVPPTEGLARHVSSRTVGLTGLGGLIAFSIVACYAYYPAPEEVLEEMRLARVEVLSGTTSGNYEQTLHWIPILDEWSRKIEVGYAIRRFELRPYQQMQTYLLRKKLELLEHAVEHAMEMTADSTETGSPHAEHDADGDHDHDDHDDADLQHDSHDDSQEHEHDDDHGHGHGLEEELQEIAELRTQIVRNAGRLTRAFQ